MRLPALVLLTVALLLSPSSMLRAAEQEPAFKPTILLRLDPLDTLIGDLRHLAKKIGQDELSKQVERMLKGRTGPKGLEGVDTKKAIGLYGVAKPKLDESEVMLLLPIADEKEFLTFLGNLDFKAEKGKDGLYTLQVETVPFPMLFRFAYGYLYGTLKTSAASTVPAADKLPKPETVLASGSGMLSLTVNVDQLPAQIRKLAISFASLQLGEMKEQELPGETEKQTELRKAALDELARQLKSVLEEGTAAQLKLAVDRKNDEVAMSFKFAGKDGSGLAKNLAALSGKSLAAGLLGGAGASESAMAGLLHLPLPDSVRKALAPVIDEAVTKALNTQDAEVKDLLDPLVKALMPTAKAGALDLAVDMRGPNKGGRYTLVAAMRVEKGDSIEKALKDLLDKLPAEAKKDIKLDVAQVGGVNLHQVKQSNVKDDTKELLGDGPLYFALRDDALFITLGEDALATLKDTASTKTKSNDQPLHAQLSLNRIAKLMAKTQKGAEESAKKAFAEKGSDAVKLEVSANGKGLEIGMKIKTSVLHFASLLDEARKKAKEDQ